jgi:hypothetical protein
MEGHRGFFMPCGLLIVNGNWFKKKENHIFHPKS